MTAAGCTGEFIMWHVETDFFALAVFLIMLIKNRSMRRVKDDLQGNVFFLVLVFSIISNVIDIAASIAMNVLPGWWLYEILMTLYVASMPMLAAVWVCYAYVLIHKDFRAARLRRDLTLMLAPYAVYVIMALTNPFTSLFFDLTADMRYSRGILFMPEGVGFIMFYSAVGILMVLRHWKTIEPRVNAALLMAFFVTTACVIWIQLANPGWLIINASYAIVYIWCDITVEDQRKRELYNEISIKNEELEETAARAESAAHAKTEFLSRMSHDIRTPMNAIIGLTHLAEDEDNIDIIKEYLGKIDSASDFLLGLINDILDMSKIENGDLKLSEDTFTRHDFIKSINTVIRPLMDAREINFVFRMESGIECIKTDKLRYNQIFFNLLSNAAKFTPRGGTVEFISENLPEKDGLVGIRYYVKDNGIGMSDDFLPHIYDPFSQETSSSGDTGGSGGNSKGTGLGLPIVKSLVDAMGGTISVKSRLGEGTEFIVEIYTPRGEIEEKDVKEKTSRDDLNGVKIMLVEDNEINIYVAQIILERAGCFIRTARNGKEAVDEFMQAPPGYFDAILMDVRMPVMDGIEATKAIRSSGRPDEKTVPIIAMTADAFEEEQKKTLGAGMDHHLSKPIDPELLYSVLAQYAGEKRPGAESENM